VLDKLRTLSRPVVDSSDTIWDTGLAVVRALAHGIYNHDKRE